MTQADLAKRLNINRCLIYMWAKCLRRIGPKTLENLSKLTNGKVSTIEDVKD
ncbi:MAG: hypothetical protein V4509_01965 [Patescibacteria group bacterium]